VNDGREHNKGPSQYGPGPAYYALANESTIIAASSEEQLERLLDAAAGPQGDSAWLPAW
jgi:hypothetical protein